MRNNELKCPEWKKAMITIRRLLVGSLAIFSLPVHAAPAEHWRCQGHIGTYVFTNDWTLVDNRMFIPKGKGSYSLVYNNDSVAVSYVMRTINGVTITDMFVIDKRNRKILNFDNVVTAALQGKYGSPDADVKIDPCERID